MIEDKSEYKHDHSSKVYRANIYDIFYSVSQFHNIIRINQPILVRFAEYSAYSSLYFMSISPYIFCNNLKVVKRFCRIFV